MTPLGKMLAIFVFLLALVWAWLTVNTFVARTNWKAEADRYQKQAQATVDGAEAIKREIESERTATKAKLLAAERDRDTALAAVVTLRKEIADLKVEIDAKLAAAAKANPEITKDNSRQKELQQEVADLTRSLGDAQKKEVDLVKITAAAKLAQEQAQRDAEAFRQRNKTLESELQTADTKLKEAIARAKSGVGEGVAVRPSAPEGFRGTVKSVGKTGEFVEITPGANAGLRSGTLLTVKRLDPKNPKYVGTLIVRDEIEPGSATCQFTVRRDRAGKRLSAEDFPMPGDVVEPDTK